MNVSRLLLGVFGIVVAGVFFFDASDYPRAAAQMPMIYAVAVGLLSLAMVAGFLSLLPGGVGVRELVVMTLISVQPAYGPVVAIVSAVLLRFSWLMAELLVSAILYFGWRAEPADEVPGSSGRN